MKNKNLIKFISIIAVLCLAFTVNVPTGLVSATAETSLEEQRDELQKKLTETDEKLEELGKQSKETEEYIEALGEKISYLTKQYELAKDEVAEIEVKVDALESNIETNEREIASMSDEIQTLEGNIATLNEEFHDVYIEYCMRMRSIYISGQSGSTLSFLLSSDSLSSLLTRYQMISSVSKRDGDLLDTVQEQTEGIMQAKALLDNRTQALKEKQKTLKANKSELKAEKVTLLKSQEEMAAQQAVIEAQQEEQNRILLDLHNKTKEYGEFRDLTQAELDEIDAEIAEADKKYQTETTTKKPTTTTATTTQKPPTTGDNEDETTTEKPTTTTTTASSSYISLTYPCPRYTTITCGFGAYSGHTGCDFSTHGNEDQKIVASESGTVILVRLLERSYGHYIVIRHDKTTSSGKSVYTLYAHNNDIIVSEGQYVSKGQQIAYSGSTGNSTGPHCHFEVRIGGSSQSYAQNPANYLP